MTRDSLNLINRNKLLVFTTLILLLTLISFSFTVIAEEEINPPNNTLNSDTLEISFIGNISCMPDAISLQDSHLYIIDACNFTIVDVSNPTNPITIGYYMNESYYYPDMFSVQDDYVVLADASLLDFWILDISDPAEPQRIAVYDEEEIYNPKFYGNYVIGHVESGIKIVDVSIPTSPAKLVDYPCSVFQEFEIYGTFLYALDGDSVRIYDISDLLNIQELGTYESVNPRDVAVKENYMYILFSDGFHIVDISNKSTPILRTEVEGEYLYQGSIGVVYDIDIVDNFAFIAAGRGGFHVYNIENVDEPILIHSTPSPGDKFIEVVIGNGYAFLAESFQRVYVFQLDFLEATETSFTWLSLFTILVLPIIITRRKNQQ